MSTLTAEELQAVERTVEREVIRAASRYHSHNKPKAILLAGQPGAGKTMLSSLVIPLLGNDAVLVNGDDYRRYHPQYRSFYERYGSDSVSMTSAFSGAVTETIIEKFSDLKYNLIIEGTGRSVAVPKRTAELLASKGYSIEMSVIATRPVHSLISTVQRFYQMNEHGTIPRATAIDAHDAVVQALPANLDELCKLPVISKISIWTRDAELCYDSSDSMMYPSFALRRIWNKRWSSSEIANTKDQIEELRSLEAKIALGQGHVIDEIQRRFHRETAISRDGDMER